MRRIPERTFQQIKKYVPLSCVDIILIKNNQFLLVKRSIPPYKNKWCLPGGIIKKGQKIRHKLKEVAKEELGINNLKIVRILGFYEKSYSQRHDISHCFIVKSSCKEIKMNFQASKCEFFKKIPPNTAKFHVEMLKNAGFKL